MEGALPPEPTGPAQRHGQRHDESHQDQPEGERPWCGGQRNGLGLSWTASQHGERGFHESSLRDKIRATKTLDNKKHAWSKGGQGRKSRREPGVPTIGTPDIRRNFQCKKFQELQSKHAGGKERRGEIT